MKKKKLKKYYQSKEIKDFNEKIIDSIIIDSLKRKVDVNEKLISSLKKELNRTREQIVEQDKLIKQLKDNQKGGSILQGGQSEYEG